MARDPRRIAALAVAADDRPLLQAAFHGHARRHAESSHPEHSQVIAAVVSALAAYDRCRRTTSCVVGRTA
jgi:hypothetical protein